MAERVRTVIECARQQCRRDPSEAVLRFLLDLLAALDMNIVSGKVKNTDICSSTFEKLVSKLRPPELRKRTKDSHECWTAEQKSRLSIFQTTVSALATAIARGDTARTRIERHFPRTRHRNFDGTRVSNENCK